MNDDEQEESVQCPKCGTELPQDTLSQLMKKEQKDFAYLLLGIFFGAVLGVVGNLWVSFLLEVARSYVASSLWSTFSLIGLIATTVLSIYVLTRIAKSTAQLTSGEEKSTILKVRRNKE